MHFFSDFFVNVEVEINYNARAAIYFLFYKTTEIPFKILTSILRVHAVSQ